jgi:hypothetical protein
MFLRVTIICWLLMLGIIPLVSVVAWFATGDTTVFIMIPGALVFIGFPWLVAFLMQLIISGYWK